MGTTGSVAGSSPIIYMNMQMCTMNLAPMATGRTLTSFQDDFPGLVTYEVGSLVTIFSVVKQKEIILWEVQVSFLYYSSIIFMQ